MDVRTLEEHIGCEFGVESFGEDDEELAEAENDLHTRMPAFSDEEWAAFADEQLQQRTQQAKELQERQVTPYNADCHWSDDED